MRKGLLNKDQQKFFANLLAEKIKFRNAILERLKKAVFNLIIKVVDDNLADRIPQDWQNPIESMMDAAMDGQWEYAGALAAGLINKKVDIPGINEEREFGIFNGVIQLIIGAIISRAAIEKNNFGG